MHNFNYLHRPPHGIERSSPAEVRACTGIGQCVDGNDLVSQCTPQLPLRSIQCREETGQPKQTFRKPYESVLLRRKLDSIKLFFAFAALA
jgi:hypothetical protein